jgi:hypothetical protein
MSASGAMPRLMGMRSADMRRAEMPPPTAATHATNRPPTTPPDAKGQTHGPRGGGVSCCVPGVWWRHPTHCVHYRSGADPEDPGTSRRTARTTARLAGPWPADRLGRARAGPLSTGQCFRDG